MTRTIKTNPAYAALAYRRTILQHLIFQLKRDYIGLDTDPKEQLICEEVFHVDSVVPKEEIGYFVEELISEEEAVRLELSKFEFTKREHVKRTKRAESSGIPEEEVDEEGGEGSDPEGDPVAN